VPNPSQTLLITSAERKQKNERECKEGRHAASRDDFSVSGDKSDLVVVDPHDPTTTSETRSANAIAEPTPDGY
jgi:hypothetical protein